MRMWNPSRWTVIATASALALTMMSTAGIAVASSYKEVTVEVDGVSRPMSGFFPNVASVLAAAGVVVSEHDLVAPATEESVRSGDTVAMRSATRYDVVVDGRRDHAWSTATSVAHVLDSIGAQDSVVLAADRSTVREKLPAAADAQTVTIIADGQRIPVETTDTSDVTALLEDAGVSVSALDRVEFISEDGALTLRVSRVTRGNVSTTTAVPFTTEERADDSLEFGKTRVIEEGKDGSVTTTSYQETVDGEVTVDVLLSKERVEPVTKIVAVGTKMKDLNSADGLASMSAARDSAGAALVSSGGVWAALAQCESGGNPATNTGNGFYGAYQFSLSTWQAVGGSGLPSENSLAEQTYRAQLLQQRAGWGQWPACSASLGLR
ncbi:transglycosylase family protein [Schaalia sp. ZJ405]|nr:transglycosylase family protein [Schaalia sp. ZJ405]